MHIKHQQYVCLGPWITKNDKNYIQIGVSSWSDGDCDEENIVMLRIRFILADSQIPFDFYLMFVKSKMSLGTNTHSWP